VLQNNNTQRATSNKQPANMRWLTYFILAYVMLGIQSGISAYIPPYNGSAPNLVLLAAIFIAINAPRDAALLGCFALGVMQDLLTQQTLGVYPLAYGLVGVLVSGAQPLVHREHPVTHFSMALTGGVVVTLVLYLNGMLHPAIVRSGDIITKVRPPLGPMIYSMLYTAILAPFVLGILQRTRRAFAFAPGRRNRLSGLASRA
jgi:rod shape-determining protein MreD